MVSVAPPATRGGSRIPARKMLLKPPASTKLTVRELRANLML